MHNGDKIVVMRLRQQFFLVLGVCVLGSSFALFGQTQEELSILPPKVDEAPAVAPAECSAALIVETDGINGSPAYVFLKKQLKVMELGHRASEQLVTALRPSSSENNVGAAFMYTSIQLSSATNEYFCASFLTGRIKVSDGENRKAQEVLVRTLITVFNRMALESIQLRSHMKAATKSAESGENGMSVALADKVSATLQDRKDVGTDFDNVITMSTMLSLDASDKNAAKVDFLNMSCTERSALLRQFSALAQSTRSTSSLEVRRDFRSS